MYSPESQVSEVVQNVEQDEKVCVVWHCRNLRVQDHPAIEYAVSDYERVIPLFIFDPEFYTENGLACDARIQFLLECLEDLDSQYSDLHGGLNYFHGDPISILGEFDQHGIPVVTTADPTGSYGLRRDNAAAEACDITFIDADGLRRDVPDTRDEWSEHVESWFNESTHECDSDDIRVVHASENPNPTAIGEMYDVSPSKDIAREGGRTHAKQLLQEFIDTLPEYPGSISAPSDARTGTSQLSPYLRFGCVSVREVYQSVKNANVSGRCEEMFKSRLYWNRHYNQKLADWSGWMDTAVNPVLEGFHADSHDPELVTAWKNGETGYPMVDASMRCLEETGWLNFRMRAMCASMLCDLLQQPWKIGADWFYYHLLDADPAINYTQFQLQAGVDGTNMMRIYNPRKQVRDNDSEGEFIHKRLVLRLVMTIRIRLLSMRLRERRLLRRWNRFVMQQRKRCITQK